MKQAKGYWVRVLAYTAVAFQAVIKAGQYAYRDRRQRKRQFNQLWIASTQQHVRTVFLTARSSMAEKASVEIDRRSRLTSLYSTK
ncbi:50S ribosomal protein L20 [Klebsiella pneumoniae]|nr:50S ribosomal protein L20 [Klebsiella pneumoniae]